MQRQAEMAGIGMPEVAIYDAQLSSREKMASALERLKSTVEQPHLPDQLAAFGISGGISSGLKKLFMSHLPLDKRIARLRSSY